MNISKISISAPQFRGAQATAPKADNEHKETAKRNKIIGGVAAAALAAIVIAGIAIKKGKTGAVEQTSPTVTEKSVRHALDIVRTKDMDKQINEVAERTTEAAHKLREQDLIHAFTETGDKIHKRADVIAEMAKAASKAS